MARYDPKATAVLGLVLVDAFAFFVVTGNRDQLAVWIALNALVVIGPLVLAVVMRELRGGRG